MDEMTIGEYCGRSFREPDADIGLATFGGERLIEVEWELGEDLADE